MHNKIKDNCPGCEYKTGRKRDYNNHLSICTGNFTGSYGEKVIMDYLDKRNIKYLYDCNHGKLKGDCGLLRFDFIEFNGKRYYQPIKYGKSMSEEESIDNYTRQVKYDNIKNQYCVDNNYKLLVIHYKDQEDIEKILDDFLD